LGPLDSALLRSLNNIKYQIRITRIISPSFFEPVSGLSDLHSKPEILRPRFFWTSLWSLRPTQQTWDPQIQVLLNQSLVSQTLLSKPEILRSRFLWTSLWSLKPYSATWDSQIQVPLNQSLVSQTLHSKPWDLQTQVLWTSLWSLRPRQQTWDPQIQIPLNPSLVSQTLHSKPWDPQTQVLFEPVSGLSDLHSKPEILRSRFFWTSL